jgi:hypothetical protein
MPQPSQAPQLPPEFISPSGIPYSAKELLKAGLPPDALLQMGYPPEDLESAGIRPEAINAPTDSIHADALAMAARLNSLDSMQANTLLSMISQQDPGFAQKVMSKMSSAKMAMNPFDMLGRPPSACNVMGMPTDMDTPFAKQDTQRKAIETAISNYASRMKGQTESNKNNPGIKGPSETRPTKSQTG